MNTQNLPCQAALIASLALLAASQAFEGQCRGQSITPEFANAYSLADLGTVAGVPTPYGGLAIDPANPGVLLLGGSANNASGAIYSVPVIRNAENHIISFGTPTLRSTAPNIDGGLFVTPEGLIVYAGYPINTIGQILPGSAVPNRITTMSALNVPSSLGAVTMVPSGFPGAGRWKTASYNGGGWSDLPATGPDAQGLYTFGTATLVPGSNLSGPEGITYVPRCSPLIPGPAVMVAEYSAGRIAVLDVNASGDPIWATKRILVQSLSGAEGAAIDPVTGDFLFSTFGGSNRLWRVSGFAAFRCVADVIGSGGTSCDQTVDGDDFIAFINSFSIGDATVDPTADLVGGGPTGSDPDGTIDGSDFIAFINAFAAGC